jgi:hypothetical protein
MTTNTTQTASVIRAMHARYEQCSAEYNRIDAEEARLRRGGESLTALHLDTAMHHNRIESDTLRQAILMQVPDSWPDALILQFHVWVEQDAQAAADQVSEGERNVLSIAMDTLLDFMACEVQADHAEIGNDFQQARNMVHFKRRYRTGEVEA